MEQPKKGVIEMVNVQFDVSQIRQSNVVNVDKNCREEFSLMLHPAEMKLVQAIRAIEFGEIEGLKVENSLPVSFKGARKTCKIV
jgi:hypothetical protein